MDFILYLAFNFTIYGYLGWCLENAFSYFTRGSMQKDGFLYSPFKPMYALAMMILIYLNTVVKSNFILLIFCLVIPTTIEFITGVMMRNAFNKDYWDYSKAKYNYKGIICLEFSLYWVLLAFLTVKIIQPFIIDKVFKILAPVWLIILPIQVTVLVEDFLMTVRRFSIHKKIL